MGVGWRVPLIVVCAAAYLSGADQRTIDDRTLSAFHAFLLQRASEHSPWYYKSANAAQRKSMQHLLSGSVPLEYFPPYRLIRLVHWSPSAGPPGVVTDDLRVVYDPDQRIFVEPSISWINGFRKGSPLDLSKFAPDAVSRYVLELAGMTRRLDVYGFTIARIVREGELAFSIDFVLSRQLTRGATMMHDRIVFAPDGGIAEARFLSSEYLKL